jgi:hypothetical protein
MRKLLWASLIVLCTVATVAQSAGQGSTIEANQAVVKRAFAALNDGDLKTLNELFDPDGPGHLPNGKTYAHSPLPIPLPLRNYRIKRPSPQNSVNLGNKRSLRL